MFLKIKYVKYYVRILKKKLKCKINKIFIKNICIIYKIYVFKFKN